MALINQDDLKTLADITDLAEPSMLEYKTTDYIEKFLKQCNLDSYKRLSTGLFGDINIGAKKTFAIRADIDALPTEDGLYKHLCGHNLHTAALLTTIKLISTGKIKPKVNLRFIFQPAEEIISGAKIVIENDGLKNVSEIYALHVDPETDFGVAGIKDGAIMAGSTHFKIFFSGRGTHAAYSHKGDDLIVAMASFIINCQTIISRKINPIIPAVLSFGKVQAGTAANILPDKAEIMGTFRYIDENTKDIITREIKSYLEATEAMYKIKSIIEISEGTFPVINNEKLIIKTIKKFEKHNIQFSRDTKLSMGGEDFCFYSKIVPALFIRLGIKKDNINPLHSPNFFVPEGTLENAVNIWKAILEDE